MSEIKSISECINNIFIELTKSGNQDCQDLYKLLYYNDDKPLAHDNLDNLTNIIMQNNGLLGKELNEVLKENKMLPFPCGTDFLAEPTSLLAISYWSGDGRNIVLNDGRISIQIFTHMYLWKMKHGIRPLEIMDRILNILVCNKNIGGINNLGLIYDGTLQKKDSKNYYGYQMFFTLTNLNSGDSYGYR